MLGFNRTVLLAISPTAPPDGAQEAVVKQYNEEIANLSKELQLSRTQQRSVRDLGLQRRAMMDGSVKGPLIQHFKRKSPSNTKVNAELAAAFEKWLKEECTLVVASPNKRDCKLMPSKDGSKERESVRKYYYTFSRREVYEEAIKHPSLGGFSGFHNPKDPDSVWILLTSFEKMIPKYLSRMMHSQRKMCGCEVCIDFRNQTSALFAWRNKWLKEYTVQYKSLLDDGDMANALLVAKARDEFISDVFNPIVDGEEPSQKSTNPEDYVDAMTCPKILLDTQRVHHYKCCIDRCLACPNPPVPRGERIYGTPSLTSAK